MNTTQKSYNAHTQKLKGTDRRGLKKSSFESYEETLDAWRHQRMLRPFQPVAAQRSWSWLTIGDAKGWDAVRLNRMGVTDVTASDLDSTLLDIAKAEGLITEFRSENAESMSLPDNSFDVAFCKESLHHFPRPIIGLYEMLRIAKKGVLLIEPRDGLIDRGPVRPNGPLGLLKGLIAWLRMRLRLKRSVCPLPDRFLLGNHTGYEAVGNYIYSISSREIEKISLGMNLPAIALRGLNDHYEKGLVRYKAIEHDLEFQRLKKLLTTADRQSEEGIGSTSMLLAIIFKVPPSEDLRSDLIAQGWHVKDLDRNPHVIDEQT